MSDNGTEAHTERTWWVSTVPQQDCFLIALGLIGGRAPLQAILDVLPSDYSALIEETLRKDHDPFNSLDLLESKLRDHTTRQSSSVSHTRPKAIEPYDPKAIYELRDQGEVDICEVLLAGYEADRKRAPHVGEMIVHFSYNPVALVDDNVVKGEGSAAGWSVGGTDAETGA